MVYYKNDPGNDLVFMADTWNRDTSEVVNMKIMLKTSPDGEYRSITENAPVSLEELARRFAEELPYDIMLGKVDGRYESLSFVIREDCTAELLDIRNHSAEMVYQASLVLVYLKSVRDVMGDVPVKIENSLNKGLYTEMELAREVSEEDVAAVERRMREIIAADLPIIREVYDRDEAVDIWERYNYEEKAELLREATHVREAEFYSLEGYRNFFFGPMLPSTGHIRKFSMMKYEKGVLIRFPQPFSPDEIPPFNDDRKIYRAFSEAKHWHRLLGLSYLPDLNDCIRNGNIKGLVLLSEALQEKKIAEIADMIKESGKRVVLIAGPSSSGKTTFAKRLCVQLRVNELVPLYLGTDDYYLDRSESPVDKDGKHNFENLDALDTQLFNDDLNGLLSGREVDLPTFDFLTGKKVFGKRKTSIGPGQPIVIEGIHGLNDKLTELIDEEEKFRIYISPFTHLNIDRHNRVTTTDCRMIRRIVRDYEFRGSSAAETISQWPKVREGEDRNIFPYNEKADVMFNSALAYELSVLRKYAEPILREVGEDREEYAEAQRLLKFIEFFDAMEDEEVIPNNSIIREFVGGSIFVK